jgi:hypothetical protein
MDWKNFSREDHVYYHDTIVKGGKKNSFISADLFEQK